MARRPRLPFLPRSGYRMRRLHDAARLLPLFGLFLMILPILWSPADDDHRRTATDGLYLFAVWIALIGVAAIFARKLGRGQDDAPADPARRDGGQDAL
ncbi:MAG: hypothetical protein V4516_12260 [Pseudomonadota bacterium]